MGKKRLNFYLEEETVDHLRRMAAGFGMFTHSGPQVGQGNISALLEAIAEGDIEISVDEGTPVPPDVVSELRADLEDLRTQLMADLEEERRYIRMFVAATQQTKDREAALEEEVRQLREALQKQSSQPVDAVVKSSA